jgi:hypothetical protein
MDYAVMLFRIRFASFSVFRCKVRVLSVYRAIGIAIVY